MYDLLKVTITLFAVIDVIGSIPTIISITTNKTINSFKISLAGFIFTLLFILFGNNLIEFFGITKESFALAGGLILFILALEMILDRNIFKERHSSNNSLIFPISFPLLFGAGTLTTVVSLTTQYGIVQTIIALLLNTIFIYFVLNNIKWIEQKINSEILFLIKKLFAVFILALSMKIIVESIKIL